MEWYGYGGACNGVGVLWECAKYVGCCVSVKGVECGPHIVGELGMGCKC